MIASGPDVVRGYIDQAMRDLLPGKFDSLEARVQLLAIAGQESAFEHRRQIGGPARGLWQFEPGGGVHEVLVNPRVRLHTMAVCLLCGIAPTRVGVYLALAGDDVFAAAIARLYLYTDNKPLPPADLGSVLEAWDAYVAPWFPGDPAPDRWPRNHQIALEIYAA